MTEQMSDRDYRLAFIQAINQKQGSAERERQYYVPITNPAIRGTDLCERLLNIVDLTVGDAVTVVTGPRGSGKTSELLRLGDRLQDRAFVLVDIADILRPNEPVNIGLFLTAITVGLIERVAPTSRSRTARTAGASFWTRLKEALERLTIEGADLTVGTDGLPVQVATKIRVSLTDSPSFQTQVAKAMKNNRAAFRAEMFDMIKDLSKKLAGNQGLTPVLVIDSLEHWRGTADDAAPNSHVKVRESIERLFDDYQDELSLPGFHVVYCAPSYCHCSWARTADMLNIKVAGEHGGRFEPGLEQLRVILRQRAPGVGDLDRLFSEPEQLDLVLQTSGGLFRDLFRLVMAVILNSPTLPATSESIALALAEERRVAMAGPNGMPREQLQLLAAVAKDSQFHPTRAQQFDFDVLETLGAILRYPDGAMNYWLGVHPLFSEVIKGLDVGNSETTNAL